MKLPHLQGRSGAGSHRAPIDLSKPVAELELTVQRVVIVFIFLYLVLWNPRHAERSMHDSVVTGGSPIPITFYRLYDSTVDQGIDEIGIQLVEDPISPSCAGHYSF